MNRHWRPTPALVRAGLVSLTLTLLGVGTGRPDLVVLGCPLLILAAGAVVRRPRTVPRADTSLAHSSVREGEGTTVRASFRDTADVEHAVVALAQHRSVAYRPPTGVAAVTAASPADRLRVDVPAAPLRWGRRMVGDGLLAATSPWAGYRWGPTETHPKTLTTLPLPGRFDTAAPTPHPIGLVGTNPAGRPGDGSEFASIRPYHPGDRLRRLHWRVSLRTGTLHVTSTTAEEDSSILLVVDAVAEIGAGGGLHGSSSSLDIAVRAAGAVAEHYLHRGDRVGLRVLGSTRLNAVAMGAGGRHLRRVLDVLAQIIPGQERAVDLSRMQFRATAGTVVVVLSPMLSDEAVRATVTLAQRGLSVIVVDTIPDQPDQPDQPELGSSDERLRLAWRIRMLERDDLLARVQVAGVPVVRWRGPGTLDEVLRRLGRRASMPKLVRR